MTRAVKKPLLKKIWQYRNAYLLLIPLFSLLAVFKYYSFFYGLFRSLFKWNGMRTSLFIGFRNFVTMTGDKVFLQSLTNLALITAAGVFKILIFAFLAAELVFYLRSKRAGELYKYIFVIPLVVPFIVRVLMWRWIYDIDGVINNLLAVLGLGAYAQAWLGLSRTAIWAIIFMDFPWIGGIAFLILLAGLQSIPDSLFEVATLEGAGLGYRLLKIEIPMISGQIRYVVITTIIRSFQYFQHVLILTGRGPGTSTIIPPLHLYFQAFSFYKFGYASALGVVLFVLVLIITIVNMTLIRKSAAMD